MQAVSWATDDEAGLASLLAGRNLRPAGRRGRPHYSTCSPQRRRSEGLCRETFQKEPKNKLASYRKVRQRLAEEEARKQQEQAEREAYELRSIQILGNDKICISVILGVIQSVKSCAIFL